MFWYNRHNRMKRIAIQGIEGSFHDIAAHRFFEGEQVELVCCDTFEEMFARLKAEKDLLGLMAIENTIAGSLLHNYELLRERYDDSGRTQAPHQAQHHVSAG